MNREHSRTRKRGRQAEMSRRDALNLLGMTAGGIVSLSVLSTNRVTAAGAEGSQPPEGPQPFGLTMQTDTGVAIDAVALPSRLAFTLKGNIVPGRPIPLLPAIRKAQEPTKEQEEAAKAVRQLLAHAGSFVEPWDVELRARRLRGMIAVKFEFLNEETPDRRIRLTVNLKDRSGKSLKSMSRLCKDARVLLKQHMPMLGNPPLLSRVTNGTFYFSSEFMSAIAEVVVILEDA